MISSMNRFKMAIAYDFDGTLARGNIQENSFLPELGIDKDKFWEEVYTLCKEHEMDEVLGYMYLLIDKARKCDVPYTRESIKKHGEKVQYFPGVKEWFDNINAYANAKSLAIEHYVVSSGNKEMIEGTSIAKYFTAIYASLFKYDANNVPQWPALAVNYTNKTQYLFRINKGIHNAWENKQINTYTPDHKRHILFPNIIYIGNGLNDVPAMKMVNYQGGYSIGLYDSNESKKAAYDLLKYNRVKYVVGANYESGKDLDSLVRSIIDRIVIREGVAHFGQDR
ncbi:hypothetical protein COTS27_01008 [Spirochaetota bacterium]|nr:hypothetical protein COTS27_01008 [Spirochaetota bacterium]